MNNLNLKLNLKTVLILSIYISTIAFSVAASGKQEAEPSAMTDAENTQSLVEQILADYRGTVLSKEDVKAIHEAFREAGLRGGPELDEYIWAAGIDPDILNEKPPRQGEENHRPEEKRGSAAVVYSTLEKDINPGNFTLMSSAVDKNGELLSQYKCEKKIKGIEKSIPLNWENVPDGTKSLAIVMYHYPHADDHSDVNSYLLLWGIDPSINKIPYGMADQGNWYMGSNKDGNAISYTSPCSQNPETKMYTIALFALSEIPEDLPAYSTRDINFDSFMSAIENSSILAKAELNFRDIRE